MPVSSWSTTPSSNTGIFPGLTLDGAVMTPPQIDNAFRQMAADVASQLGKVNFKGASIPSASTVNLADATGWYIDITGSATITAFGTVDAGQMYMLCFAGALTLTHNASSLILLGGADITTAAGDVAFMMSNGSGNWKCVGYQSAGNSSAPVGAIMDYAGSAAPLRWLFCYGQAISRTTYAALFAVLSTTYGAGDGSTTFNLPDLRGRVVAGQDDMGGSSANRLTGLSGGVDGDVLGGTGGLETHTLTTAQLAAHTHTFSDTATTSNASVNHSHGTSGLASSVAGSSQTSVQGGAPNGGSVGTDDPSGSLHTHSVTVSGTTSSAGSGAAHNNVQPTIILNKIIFAGV